jgi:hypothetical protein
MFDIGILAKIAKHIKSTFTPGTGSSASRQFFFIGIATVSIVFLVDVIRYGHGVNAPWASIWGSVFVALGAIWGYGKFNATKGIDQGADSDSNK